MKQFEETAKNDLTSRSIVLKKDSLLRDMEREVKPGQKNSGGMMIVDLRIPQDGFRNWTLKIPLDIDFDLISGSIEHARYCR